MSSTRFNRIKLILSIEDFDDIPLNEYRSQCELNFNNPSLSINQIKEKIRQHYHIPDSCTFTIAPFLPFHPELENKKLITDNPNQEELKRRLECYINVTDLYSAVKEPVIHFFMYPLAFMALPVVFTIQEDYPNKGNIDFPLVKAIQGYPIAFVHYNWTFADLIEQIQRLTFHYIYSNIPGEQSTRDHTQLTVRLFNLDREEHASLVTIVHNESMIIKLSSSSEPILKKLRKHLETLQWTEAPLLTDLPPLKPSSGSSMVRPSDNDDFYTPRQSFSSEDRPANLKMPTSSSDPIVDILKQEIVAGFLKIGLMVSEETIDKLQACSTTVHAAMDYYFDNLHLFTSDEPIEKHHGEDDVIIPSAPSAEQDFYDAKEEIEIPDNCNQEKEGEVKEEVNDNDRNGGEGSFKGSSPYEIINAEDFEELDYLEADEFFVSSTMAPAPVVPQTTSDRPHHVIPPLPPSPPSLHVPADFISAAASSSNNTMTDNERYRKRFQDIGFELNEVQIEELMLRASTFDGMINYYLSNLALFHSASSPYSSTLRSNRHNPHQHGLQGREERKGSDSPVAEKQCAICFCDCDVEKEMYSLNCCENHYFCLNCLGRLIMIAVNGSEDTAPYIPACPFANRPIADGGCEYVITEKECTQIIHRIINSPSMDLLSYSQGQDLLQKCTRLYLLRGYRQANCIRCPSCPSELEDEAYWVSLPTTDPKNRMMRVDCPTCFASFCSSCLKFPYHYGCKCDEVMPYMRAWMDWMGVGRQRYLQELAKHEEKYRHVLEEFQSKKAEHDKKVKEAEDRFKEFQESEVALSRFCRACPHCGCRIEKIDGCDAMVCGRDAHGVSIGLGCGKNFSWNGAPFYRANTADKKMPEEFNMVPPDKAFEIRHEIEEGIALPCDCCGSGIVGPKIQCLNCPSYTVCINCSTNTAYDDLSGLLIGSHHSSHVCKVIFEK